MAGCHTRDKDFAVTQAAITLPLLRNGTLLQNYLVSDHLPHPLSAASLRLQAILGKSWHCLGIKATCVIRPDPSGTLVPQSCSKYGGKAQGRVLQGAQRDRGWKWKAWLLFISQDVPIPGTAIGMEQSGWGSCPPPGPSCQYSPSGMGRQHWASHGAGYPVLFIYLKATEAVTEPWPHLDTSHPLLSAGLLSAARCPLSSPPSPLPHHLLAS